MTMFSTNKPSNSHYHYVSAQSIDLDYMLAVEIDQTLQCFCTSRNLLIQTPFTEEHAVYIKPIECDQTFDISTEIKSLAEKVLLKVKPIDKSLILSSTNHHKLLMYLHSAIEKSDILNDHLMEFRPICMENTDDQREFLDSLQEEIRGIAETCDNIEAEIEKLLGVLLQKRFVLNKRNQIN